MPNNVGSINTRDSMADDDVKKWDEVNGTKWSYGKICKGVKGLKMHQKRFRVIEGLCEDEVVVGNSSIDCGSLLDDYTEVPAD